MFSIHTKIYGEKNHQVVMVFAGWKMTQWQLLLLGHMLASYDFKAIVLTWDKDILTSDTTLTLKRFEEVKQKALQIFSQLSKKEQKNISLFGISQGSDLAFMTACDLPQVNKIIFNLVGADFAEVIWSWEDNKSGLKKKLIKEHMTLKKLKEIWSPLSPIRNLDNFRAKEVLLYLSERDDVMPFKEQELFLEALKKRDNRVEAIVNTRHKHGLSLLVNLLRFPTYVTFLKKPLSRQSKVQK